MQGAGPSRPDCANGTYGSDRTLDEGNAAVRRRRGGATLPPRNIVVSRRDAVSALEKERGVRTKDFPATRPVKHHSQDRKLEVNLQLELDMSWLVGLPKNPAVSCWAIKVRTRARKHGAIQEIKELRTEFHIEFFAN